MNKKFYDDLRGVFHVLSRDILTTCDNWAEIHTIFILMCDIIIRTSIRTSETEKDWNIKNIQPQPKF